MSLACHVTIVVFLENIQNSSCYEYDFDGDYDDDRFLLCLEHRILV